MKKTIIVCYLLAIVMCVACFSGCGSSTKDVPIETIHNNIKQAYGADYMPNTEMPEDMLKSEFNLNMSLIESDFVAEMPMIGTHPDRLIIVKAVDDNSAAAVEEAFYKTKESKISDTMQYPMNVAKINSAQVVRKGNYVAFILLGAIDEREDVSDSDAKTFAEEQTQKGVNAFNKSFE